MNPLSLAGALGAMQLIKAASSSMNAIGVTEEEYRLLTQSQPWLGPEHNRVRRTLDTMIWGSLDLAGLPRLQPPAEYLAAAIASFVAGSNILAACRLLEGLPPADELVAGKGKTDTVVRADHLFTFILQLLGDQSAAKDVFEKQLGIRASQALEETGDAQNSKKK